MNKVNHKMIQLARESRGYTQTELAELTDIPQSNLSRIERDALNVSPENLKKLCATLSYPEEFFFQQITLATTDTHYRKAIVIEQKTKLKAEALMNIYKANIEEMLKSLELSTHNIPVLKEETDSPEKVAQFLRSYWKIPKGAVQNLAQVIEDNGIIIIQLDFDTDKIDGRTIVTDTGHPIIFINKNASGDRQRLTLAHELGHVILHMNSIPSFSRDEEGDAFGFGIEFLMPLSECKYDLEGRLTIEKLADLKRIWKISMQSIVFRAQKQSLITYNSARYLWSQFASRGWRKVEPIEVPKEEATLLNRMANLFITDLEYSKKELAGIFRLNVDEMEERFFTKSKRLKVA
ncbi:MAG: ImmA/IrrE family metallo-endopeptidase [Bacteroidetes bacterium]|nr:ImmA/IrrE family metallo-endopeptidase [Bacteroidota bacterium]